MKYFFPMIKKWKISPEYGSAHDLECILKIKDSFYSSHIIAIKENTIADLSFNSKSAQCVFESLKQLEDAVTTIIPYYK